MAPKYAPKCCTACLFYGRLSSYRRIAGFLDINDNTHDEADAYRFHGVAADFHEHVYETATDYQKSIVPFDQIDDVHPTSDRRLGGSVWNGPGRMEDHLIRVMTGAIRSTASEGFSGAKYRGSKEKMEERFSADVTSLFNKNWEAESAKWRRGKKNKGRKNKGLNDSGSGDGPRRRRSRTRSLGNSHVPEDENDNFDMFR